MIQAVYTVATGRIRQVVNSRTLHARDGESVLIVPSGVIFNNQTHYVSVDGNSWALLERPPAPAVVLSATEVVADGESEILLTGVPAGATVSVNQTVITADGDDIVITTDLLGTNQVSVDAFPAMLWEGSFDGTTA